MKKAYKCNKCRDTGWILQEDRTCRECECMKKERTKKQFKKAGLNIENSEQTFENFQEWNQKSIMAKNIALKFLRDFKAIKNTKNNSILLSGQPGSGKTHLSMAIAIRLLKNYSVVYMPFRDAITKIKQNVLDRDYYKQELTKFQGAEILLVDDLYKGKTTESDINILFEIINYRYLNHLPIIVSTELTIKDILGKDEAIGSRIYEMCKDYVVQIEKNLQNNYRLRR